MISAGNDIVALDAIDRQRTVLPRFYSKIISLSEKELYSRTGFSEMPFEHFVWLLWSVKESVHKYCHRIEPGLIFSPARIVVRELNGLRCKEEEDWCGSLDRGFAGKTFFKGVVHSGTGAFHFRSTVHADHISTVVNVDEHFDQVWSGVASIDRTDRAVQSSSVRTLILDKLSSLLPPEGGTLRIEKNPHGCPVVYKGDTELGIPVSLAHHGHFIAYSFRMKHEAFYESSGAIHGIRAFGSSQGSA